MDVFFTEEFKMLEHSQFILLFIRNFKERLMVLNCLTEVFIYN